jgi:hypothetical protein
METTRKVGRSGAGYPSFRHTLGFCILLPIATLSCHFVSNHETLNEPRVEFGIFFGTQLQQRKDIPLVTDNLKQEQGFRIEFTRKRANPSNVEWEIDYPTKRQGPRGPSNAPRATRKGQSVLPQGVDRFEQRIPLMPTDSVGTWNIRVRIDGELILDRPFRVVSDNPNP